MLSPLDYQPTPPDKRDYGIGVVGCGGIVRHAHLPAYRQFGYRVTGCCDIDPAAVNAVQAQFDVPFRTTAVEELIYRDDVEIIDLAVHASVRREVMEVVSRAGKPVLSQKPFAMTWDDAAAMVAMCRERGVKLMVNQQARWGRSTGPSRRLRSTVECWGTSTAWSISTAASRTSRALGS